MIPWVERGTAPGRIVASQVEGGKVRRTRPLCAYPQIAQYSGQGDTENQANYRCADPR